jgi:DNA-binding XRE family transcriptional regulator
MVLTESLPLSFAPPVAQVRLCAAEPLSVSTVRQAAGYQKCHLKSVALKSSFLDNLRLINLGLSMVRKSSDALRAVLAENIKAFRRAKGFSQEALAELCGLHRTYIGSVERRERNVTLSTLEVLAATLSVTVPDLLTKEDRPSNNEQMGTPV